MRPRAPAPRRHRPCWSVRSSCPAAARPGNLQHGKVGAPHWPAGPRLPQQKRGPAWAPGSAASSVQVSTHRAHSIGAANVSWDQTGACGVVWYDARCAVHAVLCAGSHSEQPVMRSRRATGLSRAAPAHVLKMPPRAPRKESHHRAAAIHHPCAGPAAARRAEGWAGGSRVPGTCTSGQQAAAWLCHSNARA